VRELGRELMDETVLGRHHCVLLLLLLNVAL